MAPSMDPAQLNSVDGLVAVITGGGTGIGLMMAKVLEANGAKVYIFGRRKEKLDEAAGQAKHGNIIPIQGSVTSHDDLQRAVDQITKDVGHINLLVNNGGLMTYDESADARPMPTGSSSVAEIRDYFFDHRPAHVWTDVLETNTAGVFTTSMAFLELLDAGNKRNEGSGKPTSQIVGIGSMGGLTRYTPNFIYNASKAGVHHMMKNLGAFLVPFDIRCNVIAPGVFPSVMTEPATKRFDSNGGVMPREIIPQQRAGTEEEMCGTMLYLASKAGGYCNGIVIVLDGGFLANHSGL